MVLITCGNTQANQPAGQDLAPDRWPDAERARLEHMEQMPWPVAPREVQGRTGFVAATLSPIASHAGLQALRSGGTAADAALAAALTQVTTDLGAVVSYAGVLQLVYFDAKSGKVFSLDAGWNSYLGETDPGDGVDRRATRRACVCRGRIVGHMVILTGQRGVCLRGC